MKKLLLVMFAVLMLFCIAACGESEAEKDQTEDTTVAAPEPEIPRWSIEADNRTVDNLDAEDAENITIIQIDGVSYEGVSIYELYKSAGISMDESLATVFTANGDKHICLLNDYFLIISKEGEYLDAPELCYGEDKKIYGKIVKIVLGTVYIGST